MRRCYLLAVAGVLAWAGSSPGIGQEPDETVETLLHGLEARDHGGSLCGRVLLAYVSSPEYAAWHHARENLAWEPGPEQPGFERRILNAYVVDFALDRPRWRCETRALVTSGLDWLAFQGPTPPVPKPEMKPETMYRLSASDGELVFRYDRTSRTGQVLPLEPSLVEDAGGIGLVEMALVATAPQYISQRFRGDLGARHVGTTTMDGLACHILLGEGGHPDPKGYFRLWVAPDRDCGAVRFEHVETDAEGMAATCSVTRAFDWVIDPTTGVWMPRRWQRDAFDYPKDGPKGWTFSQVIISQELSLGEAPHGERCLPALPFDTTVMDQRTGQPLWDPTRDVQGLLAQLVVAEPDPFGSILRDGPARAALE